MNQKAHGFTIVELLIMIVVIAILAALSYVGYTNIQSRAQYVRQVAELDKIGRAIQLWSAESGTSLASSGAGASGVGVGWFAAKNGASYTAISLEDLLRNSGYLSGEIDPTVFDKTRVLLTPCTTDQDTRWVVLATVTPAPQKSVASQISETGCTNPSITTYTGVGYNSNLLKAY